MTTPATITQTRGLAELAKQSDGATKDLWVLVHRSDGAILEGALSGVEPTQLTVLDGATQATVRVAASEISGLAVRTPRRFREWLLAAAAIVGATIALVGYASLPWVRPGKGDVTNGFMALYSAAGALVPIVLARTRLGKWLTEWRTVYPPGN